MVRVCALVFSVLLASSAAFAQVSSTTGSINGKVTDNTGGVLPGVTVTASSPSMQGIRTDVTNEAGEYRFPAVAPGQYKLVYELAGFGTVNREGVQVGLGFTATVNIELAVASLQETVTVSGESPVVDVSTTTTASNFGEERLAALPNARDFWTVLMAAPAVVVTRIDVGGSAAGTQTGYAVYDTKEDQHRPMVEGIVNTEGTNAAGFYYDYGSIDEVAVQTKGHTAEMPWPGVWSNFIAKSGGNEFRGKIYADYQSKSVQRENIPDDFTFLCPGGRCGNLTPSDLNRMESYHDVNGDIGGYIIKDKIWWYGSARDQKIKTQVPNFPVKAFETGLRNLTGKITYALSQNNKLTAYAQGGQKHQPNRMDRFLVGRDGGPPQHRRVDLEPAVLGPHLQGRLRVGDQRQDVPRDPRRPVQVRVAEHPPLRSRRPTRTSATRSSAAATATAGSTSRPGTRSPARPPTTRTAGWAATTSRRAASGSARPSPTSAVKASTASSRATCCT